MNWPIMNEEDREDPIRLLHESILKGRVDVLRSILTEIADKPHFHDVLDSISTEEGTLLHVAVKLGCLDSVRTLLNAGANPCIQDSTGRTPLQCSSSEEIRSVFVQEMLHATAQSKLGRVCQLISSGVHINSVDSPKSGNTPLHWATFYGNEAVVRTLCEGGADPNRGNLKGETPLHDAVIRGNDVIVRCLLQFGADANLKNANGIDSFKLAQMKDKVDILRMLSLHSVAARTLHRSASVDSEMDRCSVPSSETSSFLMSSDNRRPSAQPTSWTDLLWPQPRHLVLDSKGAMTAFPSDGKLKIYFHPAGGGHPRRLMQILSLYRSLLLGCQLELEYRGHSPLDQSPIAGRITVGVFDHSFVSGSYTLSIEEQGIELCANDYQGVRFGFATLTQILRLHKKQDVNAKEALPCLIIRDGPDLAFRAFFLDFSGCRILTIDSLLSLTTCLGYCKANYLFINWELRPSDRYQLPYTNRELFHLVQVCDELFVQLVPSLEFNSSYVDVDQAGRLIDQFLDDFPSIDTAHFGANLATILLTNRRLLESVQRRAKRLFLSLDLDTKAASSADDDCLLDNVPPYVTVCLPGQFPFDWDGFLSPKINVVLKFSTNDVGYLCQAPETTVKNAILAAKLGDKLTFRGTMICDLSTGCEIMPPSLSYIPEMAILGVSWNRNVDMKRFCFLLPRIIAEHILLDGNMTVLFQQASTLGRVEHELTKLGAGLLKNGPVDDTGPARTKPTISVFVEMLLNPDHMTLERFTPVAFKKARIVLRRSLKTLVNVRKELPYSFELALVLAEIQLATELLALVSRLGQELAVHGINPVQQQQRQQQPLGLAAINVGVANLPLPIRTDLANSLLAIRTQFQHTWLSRNIPSTLPNALKIFDNLFLALLPPSLQDYSKNLL